eukprot:4185225-Amphidinium_carterae.1
MDDGDHPLAAVLKWQSAILNGFLALFSFFPFGCVRLCGKTNESNTARIDLPASCVLGRRRDH